MVRQYVLPEWTPGVDSLSFVILTLFMEEEDPGKATDLEKGFQNVVLGPMQFPSGVSSSRAADLGCKQPADLEACRLHQNNHPLNFEGRKMENTTGTNCWLPQIGSWAF